MSQPDITLYFLNASRAIRVAWLLEELNLPYKVVASDRMPNKLAPPEFKEKIPAKLKKSPTIKDGDTIIQESGAIVEYLCDKYDKSNKLLGSDPAIRGKVREWIAASEGTFMMHGLAIYYAQRALPERAQQYADDIAIKLSPNMSNDLDWLESEVQSSSPSGGKYLVGNSLTAADIMMQFSIQFIYTARLGVDGKGVGIGSANSGKEKKWPAVEKWNKRLETEEDGYKRAVEKTGYVLKFEFDD